MAAQVVKYKEFISNPNWKRQKDNKKWEVYILKPPESELFIMKFIGVWKANWKFLYEYLSSIKNWDDYLTKGKYFLGREIFADEEHYKEFRVDWKMPFPITNREQFTSEWDFQSDEEGLVIWESTNHFRKCTYPRRKGLTRAEYNCSGWWLRADPNDPNLTNVTYLMNENPLGTLPAWLVNTFHRAAGAALGTTRDIVVEKYNASLRDSNK